MSMRTSMSVLKPATVAALVLAFGALSFWVGGQMGRVLSRRPLVSTVRLFRDPRPVPLFVVRTLDGRVLSSADWRGHVTIVNFWATWCQPCREEVADLVDLQRRYGSRLRVIGLSLDEGTSDDVRRWADAHGVTYPVAIASTDLQARFGGIEAVPTSFVIDPDGRVAQKHVGLFPPVVYDLEVRALAGLPANVRVERIDAAADATLGEVLQLRAIPGVDLSALASSRRTFILETLNTELCPCGCRLTLARCRTSDPTCDTSLRRARHIVDRVRRGTHP